MTDEQVSDFAEALADACEMARYEPLALPRDGLTEIELYGSTWTRSVSARHTQCRCPLGALWPELGLQRPSMGHLRRFIANAPHPMPSLEFLMAFVNGFEQFAEEPVPHEIIPFGDARGFHLGALFRELYP